MIGLNGLVHSSIRTSIVVTCDSLNECCTRMIKNHMTWLGRRTQISRVFWRLTLIVVALRHSHNTKRIMRITGFPRATMSTICTIHTATRDGKDTALIWETPKEETFTFSQNLSRIVLNCLNSPLIFLIVFKKSLTSRSTVYRDNRVYSLYSIY